MHSFWLLFSTVFGDFLYIDCFDDELVHVETGTGLVLELELGSYEIGLINGDDPEHHPRKTDSAIQFGFPKLPDNLNGAEFWRWLLKVESRMDLTLEQRETFHMMSTWIKALKRAGLERSPDFLPSVKGVTKIFPVSLDLGRIRASDMIETRKKLRGFQSEMSPTGLVASDAFDAFADQQLNDVSSTALVTGTALGRETTARRASWSGPGDMDDPAGVTAIARAGRITMSEIRGSATDLGGRTGVAGRITNRMS